MTMMCCYTHICTYFLVWVFITLISDICSRADILPREDKWQRWRGAVRERQTDPREPRSWWWMVRYVDCLVHVHRTVLPFYTYVEPELLVAMWITWCHAMSINSSDILSSLCSCALPRVEYLDSLGRSRRCLKEDLPDLQEMDRGLVKRWVGEQTSINAPPHQYQVLYTNIW